MKKETEERKKQEESKRGTEEEKDRTGDEMEEKRKESTEEKRRRLLSVLPYRERSDLAVFCWSLMRVEKNGCCFLRLSSD